MNLADKTLENGALTIGTYFVNPPFEFNQDGKNVGFEVDLVNEICKRLGVRPKYINTRWETILNELSENKYDTIVGGITITDARKQVHLYTEPYLNAGMSIIVNAKKSPHIRSIDDLKGCLIGVQADTTGLDSAKILLKNKKIKDIKIYDFAHIKDGMADLLAGKIDAFFKVSPVAHYMVKQNPDLKIISDIPDDPQPLGLAFNKKNTELFKIISDVLRQMEQDGTLERMRKQWL